LHATSIDDDDADRAANSDGDEIVIHGAQSDFARDLLRGFERRPRCIAPKYFYDAAGSELFDRICALPEYYQTRTELRILQRNAAAIAQQIGPHAEIVEFGAGSLTKIRLLLDSFGRAHAPSRYLPIDISAAHLNGAVERLRGDYPHVDVHPVIGDYTMPLELPAPIAPRINRVGFFPGSTIGNFDPGEALAFLQLASRMLRGGGLLIGVDLVKDPARLHAAYNDAQGVTAAFNLNVLRRANHELGADFDIEAFAHYAFYDPLLRRIEMHLVSRREQTVRIGEAQFDFAEGDTIHTENSYKFTVEDFRALASRAGFRPGPVWLDDERLFSVHWLHAPGHALRAPAHDRVR
jgi:dimethylhistidine N-methyltransferase